MEEMKESRLTARGEKDELAYYPRCYKEPCLGMGCNDEKCEMHQLICEKLARYEDTALDPEIVENYKQFEDEAISKNVTFAKIVELMNLDAAGLLVKLPCKIGDTVYEIMEDDIPEYEAYINERVVQDISLKQIKFCDDWFDLGSDEYPIFFNREEADNYLMELLKKHENERD